MKTLENDHNKLKESKRKKLDQEPEKNKSNVNTKKSASVERIFRK